MSTTETRLPFRGLRRLVIFPLTSDTDETITYGTAVEVAKALMALKDSPSVSSGSLDADDQVVQEDVAIDGGDLTISITNLLAAEKNTLYGSTTDNGTTVTNKDDNPGYVSVACMIWKGGTTFELRKYPKVKFSPSEESFSTKKKGSIEYATSDIKGSYIPTINSGDAKYTRIVDTSTDSAIVTSWFTTGEYHKPATT